LTFLSIYFGTIIVAFAIAGFMLVVGGFFLVFIYLPLRAAEAAEKSKKK
jgi:hypothetical protein